LAISFLCPHCKKRFDVASNLAGKKGRCTCGNVFTIPIPRPETEPAPVATLLEELPADGPLEGDPWGEQAIPSDPLGSDPLQPQWTNSSAGRPQRRRSRATGNGAPAVIFVGQQLAFWSRLGTLVALLLVFISVILAFAADNPSLMNASKTVLDIARYSLVIAGLVALVGAGLFLGLPLATAPWGVALATLLVGATGGITGSILLVSNDASSKTFIIIAIIFHFAAGILMCVLLSLLSRRHRADEAGGLAIAGIVLNAVTPVFFLLMLFLMEKQFFMGPPKPPVLVSFSGASTPAEFEKLRQEHRKSFEDYRESMLGRAKTFKWLNLICSELFVLLWGASAGLEMATLGKLWQPIRDG